MSLYNARMPSLKDKIMAQEAERLEMLEEELKNKEVEKKKVKKIK